MESANPQRAVDEFFDRDAVNWRAIYERADLFSIIHQLRHRIALEWVDGLDLPKPARALEIGCGAGLFTVALARRGFEVVASDSAPAMVEMTRRNATEAGVTVTAKSLDVHRLDEPSASYDLVVALGVVPWLHSSAIALAELSRVLRPGGYLIANADNKARLQNLADPLKPLVIRRRSRGSKAMPPTVMHWPRQFDRVLGEVGLRKVRGKAFGFGPFTLAGRHVLSEPSSVRLHDRLQNLSDRGLPLLRSTGAQYIVLARRA